jgi:hypothetical protein
MTNDERERLNMLRNIRDGHGPSTRAEAGYFWDVLEFLKGKQLNNAGIKELARLESLDNLTIEYRNTNDE